VSENPARAEDVARQLLDAQVAHQLGRLRGESLDASVAEVANRLLDAAGRHPLVDLVDADSLSGIVVRALGTVPGSAAVGGIIEMATDVVYEGPAQPFPLGEVVERVRVEALLDELLALTPVLERALERLTDSPVVGTVASRFMGRIVGEVLQANKAVADKVPGLGSLMSFGTSAASRVMGAADKQFEGLVGDAMGKGGTFAVRRLNRIVVETLRDPTTREAVLQVWDLLAAEPVRGLHRRSTREELTGVVDAAHELAISSLATERLAELTAVVVSAFFDRFGGITPTELLDELELDRHDVVADLVRIAPAVVAALDETGDLEALVRAQLEPFWTSPATLELLR
jgi:hypothetical protein